MMDFHFHTEITSLLGIEFDPLMENFDWQTKLSIAKIISTSRLTLKMLCL